MNLSEISEANLNSNSIEILKIKYILSATTKKYL